MSPDRAHEGEPSPNALTLASYQAHVDDYVRGTPSQTSTSRAEWFAEVTAGLPTTARLLELGSGTGRDARHLATRGYQVTCTDATPAFVDLLRANGHHDAYHLDMVTDPLPEGYDVIMSVAAMLHLTRPQFEDLVARVRTALPDAGRFAFSVKEGDGEAWTTVKLGAPRYFCYWQAHDLRDLVQRRGFTARITHSRGPTGEPFVRVIATPDVSC